MISISILKHNNNVNKKITHRENIYHKDIHSTASDTVEKNEIGFDPPKFFSTSIEL